MKTRAKFRVQNIMASLQSIHIKDDKGVLQWSTAKVETVTLTPVVGGSPENDKFYASTPSGEIKIGIISGEVAEFFELGKDFYVDFTPVEPAE